MSYNAFSRPRIYTNTSEYLYNKGLVSNIHTSFLSSSWHSPTMHTMVDSGNYLYYKEFSIKFIKDGLLRDINYLMLLGHTFNSSGTFFRVRFKENNNYIAQLVSYNITGQSNNSIEVKESLQNGASVFTSIDHDYVPITIEWETNSDTESNTLQSAYDEIVVECWNETGDDISFSGISIGNYYDLPYSPDLGINKTISYDSVTFESGFGKTYSSNYGSSKPFNPFMSVYSNASEETQYADLSTMDDPQDYIPSGRRSYELAYSYISKDMAGQNYLYPRDMNNPQDMANLDINKYYDSAKNNFYTSVINKTMGTHIPFIFSLNGSNPNELMLARFKDNNFSFDEVAPNVHNVSFGIREVW